jgi:hypothetical protein
MARVFACDIELSTTAISSGQFSLVVPYHSFHPSSSWRNGYISGVEKFWMRFDN